MESSRWDRACPRCDTRFNAASERGICPRCNLLFLCDRHGTLIGVVPLFVGRQFDWPISPVDDLCDAVFETLQFGGGSIFISARYAGYPSVAVVHSQLIEKFREITNSIAAHLPAAAIFDNDDDPLAPCYRDATSVKLVSWDHKGKHYQLICYLTADGGSVDVVIDRNANWHKAS